MLWDLRRSQTFHSSSAWGAVLRRSTSPLSKLGRSISAQQVEEKPAEPEAEVVEEEPEPKPRAPRSNPFGGARPREEVLAAQPTAAHTAPDIAGCVHATANIQPLAWHLSMSICLLICSSIGLANY